MPWDLTDAEAEKFNRLSGGQAVDLTPDEQTKFAPIFAERAKSAQPTLGAQALAALKEFGSNLLTPSREPAQEPSLADLRKQGVPDSEYLNRAGPPAALNDMRKLGAVASAFDIGAQNLLPDSLAKGANDFLEEGRQTYPKTALAAGVLAPFPSKVKEQMLVGGALGALHGYQHAKPGEEWKSALVGGGVNAALAGVTGKMFEGAGKLIGPQARALLERMGLSAEALGAEPHTVPESPMDVAARQQAAVNARGGEPSLVPETPPNLQGVWMPEALDPALTKAGAGAMTKASLRPGAEAPTALLPARNELAAEPLTVTDPQTEVSGLAGRRSPDDLAQLAAEARFPTPEQKAQVLANARDFNAERPTQYMIKNERAMAFAEASQALNEGGDPRPMVEWISKYQPEGGTPKITAQPAELVNRGKTRVEGGRNDVGTRALATPEPEPLDKMIADLQELPLTGTEKTKTKYVPRDLLYPEGLKDPEITHVPARDVAPILGGGSGEPPRPAAVQQSGPPVSAPLAPEDLSETFGQLAAEAKTLLNNDLSAMERFKKQLGLPEFRGSATLGHAIRSVNASRVLGDVQMQRLYPALERTLKALSPQERASAQKVIVALRDRKGTVADVARLPEAFKNLFSQVQSEQQAQLVELAKGGYFGPAELSTIAKNMAAGQLHLHRSYQAFYARKSWSPPEDAVAEAAQYIAREAKLDPVQATARVRALVKTAAEGGGFKNVQQLAGAFRDAGLLKRRVLPSELRNLLGVVNDPAFIVADTASKMSSMYHLMQRTRAIVAPELEGQTWSRRWVQGMDERPLWVEALGTAENKRLFGELAGKYVPPAMRQAMLDVPTPLVENFARDALRKMTGWFSTSKVLTSPVTWARNLLSNGLYLSASGVPMTRQPKLMVKAFGALLAARKNVSGMSASPSDWVQMALEDGALRPGRGTDFGGSEARAIAERVLKGAPEGLPGIADQLYRGVEAARLKLGSTYELFDSAARLAAYMHHVEAGRVRLQLKPMEARAHASHIVNRYFATGAGVAPIFRELSRSSLGLAPFIGWHVDNLRVAKNITADTMKGDFGSLIRTAGWSAAPMLMAVCSRYAQGITDQDVAAGERALKGSWRDRNAFHDWVPVRGKDGRLTYAISFDGLNPMALFFRGAPEQSLPKRIAASVVQGMTQSGALEPWVDTKLAELGIAPKQYEPEMLPGQEGFAAGQAIASYLEPALMRQFRTVARKAQLAGVEPLRANEEPQGLGEAFATTFSPLSVEKVGSRTEVAAQKQRAGAAADLRDAAKQMKRLPDPSERQRVRDAILERVRAIRGSH